LANELAAGSADSQRIAGLQQRERVRVFGTQACWQAKRAQFAALAAQAEEVGVLTRHERSLLLQQGRPFLLPRFYERAGLRAGGSVVAGVLEQVDYRTRRIRPSRSGIRALLASHRRANIEIAFKLVTAAVNYDLSSAPMHRESAQTFDENWLLFLDAARTDGLHAPPEGAASQALEVCSCREFDEGRTRSDALAQSSNIYSWAAREWREILFGPVR
jgi:hypothetical protein